MQASNFKGTKLMDANTKAPAIIKKNQPQNVVHSNTMFLKAGSQKPFTTQQMRLFLYILAQLPKKVDMDIPAVRIPVDTLVALMNVNTNNEPIRPFTLKEQMESLASKGASVVDSSGGIIMTTWFDYIRISPDAKSFIFQLQPLLKPFVMHLTGKFTQYQLEYILTMSSTSSIRLYDYLKTIRNMSETTIPLDELRTYLGLANYDADGNIVSYRLPTYKRLNQMVLKPSIDEINENTDIYVTYMPVKSLSDHRSIGGVKFIVKEKDMPPVCLPSLPPSEYGTAKKTRCVHIDKSDIHVDPSKGVKPFSSAEFHPAGEESLCIISEEDAQDMLMGEEGM